MKRKKQPEVGTEVGKEFKKDPTQIWPYLLFVLAGGANSMRVSRQKYTVTEA